MPGPGFAAWQAVTLGAVALSSVRLRSPALRLGRAGRVAAGGGEPWRSGSPAAGSPPQPALRLVARLHPLKRGRAAGWVPSPARSCP